MCETQVEGCTSMYETQADGCAAMHETQAAVFGIPE
jgi:hypothetical protein